MVVKYLVGKYLRFDKTQPFITLSAALAFIGVAVGLMVLIVAMAIMNGFDKEFQRKLFTMNYPITILSKFEKVSQKQVNELKKEFPNLLFSPYIASQVMIKGMSKFEGGLIFGVNFEDEAKINSIVQKGLGDVKMSDFDIMVGSGLQDSFLANFGDKMTLVFSKSEPNGFSLLPKIKRFTLRANFTSGLIAYDKVYMYASVESLRKILDYEDDVFDGVHVYSSKPFDDIVKIKSFLSNKYSIIGWWQQNGNFFSALALEKRALFIVLMLIVLVASLNIISSLLMTVMNRRQEIALLMSLGVSKDEIKKTFFSLGCLIGGSGIIFGTILGFVGIWLLGSFDIISLPADVYGTTRIPLELSMVDFVSTIIGAILIVVVFSYYPANRATKINILDTLRNE